MTLAGLLPIVRSALEPLGPLLGVSDGAKAAMVAALARDRRAPAGAQGLAPLLVVMALPERAQALAQELPAWLGEGRAIPLRGSPGPGGLGFKGAPPLLPFPVRDQAPYSRGRPEPAAIGARLRVLQAILEKETAIILAPVQALAQGTIGPQEMARSLLRLAPGSTLNPETFLRDLARCGYSPEPIVEEPGAMARRGGIIDLWPRFLPVPPGPGLPRSGMAPPAAGRPLRIELWGERVESLRLFDPQSQRSLQLLSEVSIGPAREMVPSPETVHRLEATLDLSACTPEARDRYQHEMHLLRQGVPFEGEDFYTPFLARSSLLEHLSIPALLVIDEPEELETALLEMESSAEETRRELEARGEIPRGLPPPFWRREELLAALSGYPQALRLSRWAPGPFAAPPVYGARLAVLAADVAAWRREGRRTVLVSQQAERLAEALAEAEIPAGITTSIADTPSRDAVCL